MRIFAGVLRRVGVKRHWVVENGDFSVLSVSVSSEALALRPTLLYSIMFTPHWLSTDPKKEDFKNNGMAILPL